MLPASQLFTGSLLESLDLLLSRFEIPLNPVDSDGEYVNGVHRVSASKGMNTPMAKMMDDGLPGTYR
jgi:hypothetical protein